MRRRSPAPSALRWIAVGAALVCAQVRAAVGVVQTANGSVTGSSYSVQLPQPVTAGDALVVFVIWEHPVFQPTLTDSLGNTYSSQAPIGMLTGFQTSAQLFFAPSARAGTTVVTANIASAYGYHLGVCVYELSGAAGGLDGYAAQAAPSSTSAATSAAVQTHAPGELMIAMFYDSSGSGTITPGTGWTVDATDTTAYALWEEATAGAPGGYTASATLPTTDANWLAFLASFSPSSGAGGGGGSVLPDGGLAPGPAPQAPRDYAVGCTCATGPAPGLLACVTWMALALRRRRGRSWPAA